MQFRKTRPDEAFSDNAVDKTKVDTYQMGVLFWYVLTKKWMFEGKRLSQIKNRLRRGERPEFPSHVLKSKDPAIMAMVRAIKECWIHDPNERPTSRQVRDFLIDALKKILGVDDLGVVRVSVPPLPAGHRYGTDSDFLEDLYL